MTKEYFNKELVDDWIPDINGFFDKFKQPTEKTVRNAMLFTSTDSQNGIRVSYKSGGGSVSDNNFSGSLAVTDDNEKWEVVVKRSKGSSLKDIMIDDVYIRDLIEKNLTPEQKKIEAGNIVINASYEIFLASLPVLNGKYSIEDVVADIVGLFRHKKVTTNDLEKITARVKKSNIPEKRKEIAKAITKSINLIYKKETGK